MITLYIWEPPNGGVSKWWVDDAHPDASPLTIADSAGFFVFGRFGGGWMPLASLKRETDLERIKSEAHLAIKRVRERFGRHAGVVWGPPPEGTFDDD